METDLDSSLGGETLDGKESDSPVGVRVGVSYKESLLGEIPGAYERAFFGNSMEEDGEVCSDDEDGDPPEEGEVVIKFSKELKQRIRAPWNTSLIVKVFDLIPVMGFEHVLKAGPWFVGDYFLSLRPWVPDFRASEAAVSSVAIWVRLPELPIEYYQKDSLMHIGKGLGPVLRVDYNTAAGTRGRFARICVQLDVDKPLARTIRVGKAKLAVVYEGIGQLCFHCGRIGHRLDWCPSRSLAVPATNSPNSQAEVDIPNAEETKGFGPWMIVQRRKRQAKRAVDSGKAVLVTAKVGGDDPGTSKAHAGKETPPSTAAGSHQPTSALISLRPQAPSRHDKHKMGSHPNAIGTFEVEDSGEEQDNHPLRGRYRADTERSPPRMGLVRDRACPSLEKHLPSDMPRIDGVHCPLRIHSQPSPELRLIQFLEEVYCATLPDFDERKVILSIPIQLLWKGNRASIKLAQAAKCIPHFVIVIQCSERLSEGYLSYKFSMEAKLNTLWEMWPEKAWNALEAGGNLFPTNNPPFMSSNEIGVNVLTWNCRGVLNPCFRRALLDLLKINSPAILVLTETRLGGNMVEVEHLCSTEQELHVSVKVRGSHNLWLLSAIYASPRRSERRILWKNLSVIALLHNLPWVMVGDFNDILSCEEKWGAWTSPAPNLAGTFAIFTALVSAWNKLVFGNIFQRKRRVLARMSGVQYALASNPSDSLSRLEKSLKEQYHNILNLEGGFLGPKLSLVNTFRRVFQNYSQPSHISSLDGICLPLWAPRISDTEALVLLAPITASEVRNSLWSLKPFKAPGPDGLHPGFFQRCWPQVGDSVVKEVCQIFSSGKMPEYLNKTLISLIPKCIGPETLSQFRPISLCNTVYKVVTKIIVNRIRPLLSNLVSPFQAAFIPGRRGVDNVIIAQELIHSLHKKKGRKGQFILKVDLEKAYDRLEWSFIREVLLFFNFPSRVGNLLKPLGVVLHLLLYAEASASCCHIIATVLADFCSHSGQKINLAKSKAFFSPNVTPHMRHHLCDILGVSSTPDLGKYLGFPLRIHGRNARDFRNFLWGSSEDKKKMHMVGWDKICQPKKDGGLGLYSSKPRNLALLAKLNWRLIDEKDSLWAKTLLAKYCPDGPLEIKERLRKGGFSNWKGLKMGNEVFSKGIRWVIGNGHSTSFWHDTWVGNEPLREVIHGPIPHLEESFCVVDVIEGVGVWDFSRISFTLPKIISDSIRAVSVCSFSNKEDCLAWDSSDGGFNLGKAYQLACKPSNVINGPSSWLWKVKTSPRIINQIIFKAKSILPNSAVCAVSHASGFFYLMDVKINAKNRVLILVKWNPPPVNWAKLNTDGLVLGDPGLAGGGGVIRDSLGNWLVGFSRSIGITSCVQAELRALKDGLLLALDLEISKLEIEMDSSVAVESLKTTSMPNVFLRSIVDDCRLLLERFEATTIKHIYREANGCADALAKTGCVQHVNISFYPSAPAHVLEALAFDNSVATRTRFVLL
uniref:CCHC-type domain-containing protein n=1 Tax=Fagus sylvatica TaxID=28930 RepID=A0A2N9FPJ3_FAGSY